MFDTIWTIWLLFLMLTVDKEYKWININFFFYYNLYFHCNNPKTLKE